MRPALGRAVEWQFFRTLCHADVGNLPQGSQGSQGSMMGTSIFYRLNLKACWKRIPTMMDAFRGGRWMAVGGPPKYNVGPQNSWRVGYGDIYI